MADSTSTIGRIDKLNRRLQQKRKTTNLGSTLTLLIGLVAIGLLSFYFYYGYTQFQEISDPHTLIKIGKDQLNSNLTAVREMAAKQIRESAPQWAEEASKSIIDQMPVGRKEIEAQLTTFIDTQFQDAKVVSQEKFREMIAQNRADIQAAVDTILSDKESEAFVSAFMPVVEKTVGIDVQNNAAEALGAFGELNQRLDRLAKGEKLSEIEQQQRYVLGLVQRLRLEQSDLK